MELERRITITDRGINIEGVWTVGEVLQAAQTLANSVNAMKIGTPQTEPQEPDNAG